MSQSSSAVAQDGSCGRKTNIEESFLDTNSKSVKPKALLFAGIKGETLKQKELDCRTGRLQITSRTRLGLTPQQRWRKIKEAS